MTAPAQARRGPLKQTFLQREALDAARVKKNAPLVVNFARPWLYPKQTEFLYNEARYSIVEAATKTGKTVGCLIWLIEQAAILGGQNRNFWWVAPIFGQADIAFRRAKRVIPEGMARFNNMDRTIELINGSVIWFKSAVDPDRLYGEDVYAAVLDEATRMRSAAFVAVRSTLTATRGKMRIIGNVKGRKNWVFKLARKAEQAIREGRYSTYYYAKLTAYDAVDAGLYSMEEIEDAKETLPEEAFKELYLAEASEDGANPFGIRAIRSCFGPIEGNDVQTVAAVGVDLGKHQDHTVIHALNENGSTAFWRRFPLGMTYNDQFAHIKDLIARWPNAYWLIDSTGNQDPLVERWQESAEVSGQVDGFVFTSGSKQKIMEGLALTIQQSAISFPSEGEYATIAHELENFEFTYSARGAVMYAAAEGFHDDAVCALAMANEALRIRPPHLARALSFRPFGTARVSPYSV